MNPNNMSVDECLTWLANDDGHPLALSSTSYEHSLDSAARAMPECTNVSIHLKASDDFDGKPIKQEVHATAYRADPMGRSDALSESVIADDELTARFRLAVLVRMRLKEPTNA